jgi:hypothetical protein
MRYLLENVPVLHGYLLPVLALPLSNPLLSAGNAERLDIPVSTVNAIYVLIVGDMPQDTALGIAHTTGVKIMANGEIMLGTIEEMEEGLGGTRITIGTTATTMTPLNTISILKARSPKSINRG